MKATVFYVLNFNTWKDGKFGYKFPSDFIFFMQNAIFNYRSMYFTTFFIIVFQKNLFHILEL